MIMMTMTMTMTMTLTLTMTMTMTMTMTRHLQDMDCVTFGSPLLLRKMTFSSSNKVSEMRANLSND